MLRGKGMESESEKKMVKVRLRVPYGSRKVHDITESGT